MPTVQQGPRNFAHYIMRPTGPQQFYTMGFTPGQNTPIPKSIPLNQPLGFIHIQWAGRIVIGVANYTSVSPESLLNILMNFKLTGTHVTLSNITPFNTTGANLFKYAKIWNIRGNSVWINGVRISDDQMSQGIPIATFGNTGTYDVRVHWTIPVFPMGIPDQQAILYLYNAAAWNQTLQMSLQQGDLSSFGTPGGTTTVTFSSFGSGAGSPVWNILTSYVSLGSELSGKIAQAVKVLNDIPISSVLQSAATQIQLAQLQLQKTTAVIIKTGTTQAATGGNIFATLSDFIMENTVIKVNNNAIRNLLVNDITKEFYGYRQQTNQPIGYLGILFDDGFPASNAWTAFHGENPKLAGSTFAAFANIVGAAGGNGGNVLQEYILGTPATKT